MPGMVAAQLVIPIKTPANLGAMSIWLILNPAFARPTPPTDMVRNMTESSFFLPKYPVTRRPAAPETNAIQIERAIKYWYAFYQSYQ